MVNSHHVDPLVTTPGAGDTLAGLRFTHGGSCIILQHTEITPEEPGVTPAGHELLLAGSGIHLQLLSLHLQDLGSHLQDLVSYLQDMLVTLAEPEFTL